jgi:hypothetical protein
MDGIKGYYVKRNEPDSGRHDLTNMWKLKRCVHESGLVVSKD